MARSRILSRGKLILALIAAMALGSMLTAVALARTQPNMIDARNSLKSAIGYLEAAHDNKGGHRTAAIRLCRQAIGEINLGIQWADTHAR